MAQKLRNKKKISDKDFAKAITIALKEDRELLMRLAKV